MEVNIYRKKIKIGRLLSYIIYIDGLNKSSLEVGETTQLDLPPGKHVLTVEPYLPTEYAGPFLQFLSRMTPYHSNKIELDSDQITNSGYVLVENRNKSIIDSLIRIYLYILYSILSREKPHKILLKKVSKENFETCRKEDSEIKYLTPKAKRFVFGEIVTSLFLSLFGLCVYNLTEGLARSLAIPLFLVFIGSVTNLFGQQHLSKFMLTPPSLKIFRFRVLLYEICLAVIAFHTVTHPFIFGFSILFIAVYAFIFFKAKPVLAK